MTPKYGFSVLPNLEFILGKARNPGPIVYEACVSWIKTKGWWRSRDLNPGQMDYDSTALTN
jgi:hypothetical protein